MIDEGYFRVRYRHGRLFSKGWGDAATHSAIKERFCAAAPPFPIQVEWEGPWQTNEHVLVRDGKFETPYFAEHLPAVARTAYFRLMLPRNHPSPRVYVHMATTGEEGYAAREKHAALPLAREGVGVLMLEHPFLGRRRPAEQATALVDVVTDLLLLGGCAVEEARSVLSWLHAQGYSKLGIVGISKGGHLAALAGTQLPFDIAIVPLVAPHSGVPVFTEGLMSRLCDWQALNSEAYARKRLRELLHFTSVETFPPPRAGCPVFAVAATSDQFVPRASSETLQAHWPSAHFRWVSGGHVSSIALKKQLFRRTMLEAIQAV
jgi:predicted alpha/beta hydrolase